MPNKLIFGESMQNFSANDLRRIDVAVGVGYGADIDQTRQVLTEAVKSVDNHGSEIPPEVYLVELSTSSVDWVACLGSSTILLGSPGSHYGCRKIPGCSRYYHPFPTNGCAFGPE